MFRWEERGYIWWNLKNLNSEIETFWRAQNCIQFFGGYTNVRREARKIQLIPMSIFFHFKSFRLLKFGNPLIHSGVMTKNFSSDIYNLSIQACVFWFRRNVQALNMMSRCIAKHKISNSNRSIDIHHLLTRSLNYTLTAAH